MALSPSTKPYVVEGFEGKTYKTALGLMKAIERAGGTIVSTATPWRVLWPGDPGPMSYEVRETDRAILIDEILGWDLS